MAPPAQIPAGVPRSQPRRGIVGIDVSDDMPTEHAHSRLRIVVRCPACTNYAVIVGHGSEFRHVTEILRPTFECSVCSYDPGADPAGPPEGWTTWYQGRVQGTLLWAVNEEHLELLERYLETPPKRRELVEFDSTFLRLMQRLPPQIESGRRRSEAVSLVKRLRTTRPRGVRI